MEALVDIVFVPCSAFYQTYQRRPRITAQTLVSLPLFRNRHITMIAQRIAEAKKPIFGNIRI